MTDELKPVRCGCGGEAKVIHYRNGTRIAVSCTECDIETISYMTEAEAIQAWNKAMDRKMGLWETEKDFDGDELYRCPICGELWVLIDGTPKDNNYNYCPNCGARLGWE